jgi:hypothetical protein
MVIFTHRIFPLLTPSINTNKNISLVYIEGIAVEIEGRKKPNSAMMCMTQLPMKLQ